MNLSNFITAHMDVILAEWEAFAGTLEPAAGHMSPLALRDHAKGILHAIALDIQTRQNALEQQQKSQGLADEADGIESAASIHGALRHDSNFSLLQLSAEYRALRATVLRLWLPNVSAMSASTSAEMVRFNEAIDQALAESVVTYSARADQTRELFLAVLGHDLRAPLSTLSMAAQLLTSEKTPAAQVGPIGVRIERASRVMGMMVDDLIGYARTQLGAGMPTTVVVADLRSVCEAALEDAGSTHPGTRFDVALDGDLHGRFDPVRLHQLLTNLLINAAQYGGHAAPVLLRAHADAQTLTVEVTNQGSTIPPDSLQSIFRPLVQLPAEASDERPRTSLGLGLFIAREIALAHGGSIAVSSNEASGTTFCVRLPRNS
ncbi:MAG: HAMP domain-containing sensor histidine kinase [Pseudomonadota bacterium]|nr:HAMP domain-containing sensor histidine kinase [Pseudomonadota bacterium]